MNIIISKSEQETFNEGKKLGQSCRGGESFFLNGDLGAGKTKFIQGLAQGLGVKERVNSPTFNILKLYSIKQRKIKKDFPGQIKRFCHIDAYRLKSSAELIFLGVQEFLNSPNTVTAIEWGEKVKKIRPDSAQQIKIKLISENCREIRFF